MKFTADSVVFQGSGHLEIGCQDYALVGNGKFPYIIVSDGCSSSKNVDVGARLLACCALKQINQNIASGDSPFNCWISGIKRLLVSAKFFFDLDDTFLDATLLTAIIHNNKLQIFLIGDGVLAVEYPDYIDIFSYNYSSGCPFYLNYHLDDNRLAFYKKQCADSTLDFRYLRISKVNGSIKEENGSFSPFISPQFEFDLAVDKILLITLASDGLNSFQRKFTLEKVDLKDLWKDFFSFPNTTGLFLKRKGLLLQRKMQKEGLFHFDDISLTTIAIKQ